MKGIFDDYTDENWSKDENIIEFYRQIKELYKDDEEDNMVDIVDKERLIETYEKMLERCKYYKED